MERAYCLQEAVEEAKKARDIGEVPIGAVVVLEGEIIGRAHNLRETSQNAVTHAGMLAIQDARKYQNPWRLRGRLSYTSPSPRD
nr:deaminase [Listeria monocytogenes]